MSENQEIRWQQRLYNFKKALKNLSEAVDLYQQRPLSKLEKQGIIQAFEFTHELAWNVMKDFFYYQGNSAITGSRDATRQSFHAGLIEDGEGWMQMILSRNKTSHTYNEETAEEMVILIVSHYYSLFVNFEKKMTEISAKH